jgi:DNA/RNA-binding domain of Phe-tRNA-synthetase-like protein
MIGHAFDRSFLDWQKYPWLAALHNVFDHALCWIHAERVINRLIPLNDDHVKAVDDAREQLWSIYHGLKAYKLNPVTEQADSIKQRFQTLCSTKTCYETLNLFQIIPK